VRSPASSMRSTLVFLLLCGIAHAEERLLTRAFRHGSRLPAASTEACCAFSLFELECADHPLIDSCAKSELPEGWQTRAKNLNINLKKGNTPKKWKTVIQKVVGKCFPKRTSLGKIDRTRCESQTSGDTADVQKDVPVDAVPSVEAVPSVDAVPSDSIPSFDPVQENGDAEDADVQKNVPGGGDPAPGVDSVPSVTPVQTNFGRCKSLDEETCCKAEPDTTAPCFYVGKFTKKGGKDTVLGWKCSSMDAVSYLTNSRGGDGLYWEAQKCRTAKADEEDEKDASVGTEAKCNAIGDDCAACEKQGCAYYSVSGSSGGGTQGVATEANGYCSGVKYALNQKVGQKNGMYTKTTCVEG